jgi:hypothetical protein
LRRCTTDARAELNWSNLHAGPDFAKASSRQAAYAPLRRDAHAEVEKLTGGSIPAPFYFSNFEESVLNRSVLVYDVWVTSTSTRKYPICNRF